MRLSRLRQGAKLRRFAAIALATGVVSVAGLASSPPAQAGLRENLINAQQCLNGGWKTLTRTNGTSFRNLGACVVYAVLGGQFGSTGGGGGGSE